MTVIVNVPPLALLYKFAGCELVAAVIVLVAPPRFVAGLNATRPSALIGAIDCVADVPVDVSGMATGALAVAS